MDRNRKFVLDCFQKHVQDHFLSWCHLQQVEATHEHLITFLIDQDLIPPATIQQYAVCKEYGNLNQDGAGAKTALVNLLAHRFNVSERTVWSLLKKNADTTRS